MHTNATVSSRSSSSRSANSCSRNSSMPSLRIHNPLTSKTSFNPLYRHSDAFTSFDASQFVFQEQKRKEYKQQKNIAALRRYHSHDSSTTNFGTTDLIDNSNIIINNNNSDITPESTKSRSSDTNSSNEIKKPQEYDARDFLEKYSLPRVVRVSGGEPLLLYRCFDSFTKIQARSVTGKKGKEKTDNQILHFPEGYSGWFSLTNEKGEKSAVTYTSILQLVREQVCSFLSIQPFTAYAAQNTDLSGGKVQYLKTQAKGGQLFQLRAVFQHKDRPDGSNGRNSTRSSSRISRSVRDKDLANRYAQLVSQTNQELYVPLTVKGEFYEIHSSMKARLCFAGMLDKTGPLALDRDCLYKITHLVRRVALPIRVKLITGPLPPGLPKDFTDTFVLVSKFQEPLMVTCTLPPPNQDLIQHEISCISMNSNLKLSKSTLGFDTENRLFKSQRLQAALAFCHKNVENWYREVRLAPNIQQQQQQPQPVICDSKEKSLELIDDGGGDDMVVKMETPEKRPKKWYKHFKLFNDMKEPMDGMEKERGIDRYKDMSKLIEEKFGKRSYNPVKKSASFMFSTKRLDLEHTTDKNNPALLKCQSLDTQLYSIEERTNQKCDNISYDFQMCLLDINNDDNKNNKKKNKPDLIPTLPKQSLITERLCNEFHVKTKVQKKSLISKTDIKRSNCHLKQQPQPQQQRVIVNHVKQQDVVKSVTVQVHQVLNVDDIPYSHVADEAPPPPPRKSIDSENIYAEIVDNQQAPIKCKCDNNCLCNNNNNSSNSGRTKRNGEYCYVKLGSNGDSVTQSDSDEAIYNTLR